ncbi:MAG TPA: glucosidase [Acidobacteriota bacterium]|nr:glucosidase [Acidobacteriota bacterium]
MKQRTDAERMRMAEGLESPWRLWGPYLSERQWGTVREDYSAHGGAWDYFSHDHARSRAYRWGEDGLAGFSDKDQYLCLGLALWNGRDPILKERLYGLTNPEGNHGEDVKELYYYLDAAPSHSYLKMLYKYPQKEFPYRELIEANRNRGRQDVEFELLDTGIFDDDRYFDVFVEYAKADARDIFMRVTVHNRAAEEAELHLLPQAWFRNTWSWEKDSPKPLIRQTGEGQALLSHPQLGEYYLYFEEGPELLFCENETNAPRLYSVMRPGAYFKDGIHDCVVKGRRNAVNPEGAGTKVAAHYRFSLQPGATATVSLRLSPDSLQDPFKGFHALLSQRIAETDDFYARLQASVEDEDARLIQRQALAGMIWSKQLYHFDVDRWLQGDPAQPEPPADRSQGRNAEWRHLNNQEIISMPDKWEYPFYCAWDLAFHCIPLALVDPDFAKGQLILLTREWYLHPNGQLPAYEWAFSDVNPPVHAWAAWRVYQIDRKQKGVGDLDFLERVFHKLLLNFTWWVNRKDSEGNNIFQGGFLGLDNIGVFDRSAALPTGGHMHQADGTSWMAMYSLNLMRIALELAANGRRPYEDIATKFFEHFLYIAKAMTSEISGGDHSGLWDEEDQFYYDVLHLPQGRRATMRVRSLVGLIPLLAVETLEPELLEKVPEFRQRLEWFLNYRPDLAQLVSRWHEPGLGERRLLSLLRGHRMKSLLRRMLDPEEFLCQYGIRSLSRYHAEQPYHFDHGGNRFSVAYLPAESDSGLFGGNSNWRGPLWFPLNYLLIESLQKFHHYYGDDFKVECPVGSGRLATLEEVAEDLSQRLVGLYRLKGEQGRPAMAYHPKLQKDPRFRDYLLFHEYFHGDSGRGAGASHQTGWTGLVAKLIQPRRKEKAANQTEPELKERVTI